MRRVGHAQGTMAFGVGADQVAAHHLAENRAPRRVSKGPDPRQRSATGHARFSRTLGVVWPVRMSIRCPAPNHSPVRRTADRALRTASVPSNRTAGLSQRSQLPQGPRVLAEVAQQQLAAAAGGLGKAEQGVQPSVVRHLAVLRCGPLVDLGCGAYGCRRPRRGSAFPRPGPVAAGTADLLIIALDGLRQVGVHDPADVGLVDAHAEGDRRHHDQPVLALEGGLDPAALLGIEARVIGQRQVPRLPSAPAPGFRSWRGCRNRRCRTGPCAHGQSQAPDRAGFP